MEDIKINIGDKQYNVKIAETDAEQEEGLKNIKELPENEGMLFVFNEPYDVSF